MNGKPITNSIWKTKVSRDLLLCFLLHPDGLTKEQIGTLFWPECSQSQLKTRFKNAIYRLRSALEQDVISFHDNIYRFDWSTDYEYDVELFLQSLSQADNAQDLSAQIDGYRTALDLYKGSYLVDVDAEWARIEQVQLHRLFVDAALNLAEIYFDVDETEQALECCQRILAEDPCLEDVHRLAMRIHAKNGNRAAVARQYQQCQKILHDEIDAPPSPQTAELYALLMQ